MVQTARLRYERIHCGADEDSDESNAENISDHENEATAETVRSKVSSHSVLQ